jgi:hypothetical protein
MSQNVALTTNAIVTFWKDYSPTNNGNFSLTNTSFAGKFVTDTSGFIDPIVNKFNNNGTSILQNCVLNSDCKLAEGCTAVCGKLGDTHVVTFQSALEGKDRVLYVTAYNALTRTKEIDLKLTHNQADALEVGGSTSLTHDPKADPKDQAKDLKDAIDKLETALNNVKVGNTPQDGWSMGTLLGVGAGVAIGAGVVYGAQQMQKGQEGADNKARTSKFSIKA